MKPAEAVVFDLGKVLLDFDYDRAAARIAPLTCWTPEQLKRYVLDTDLLLRYETGMVTTDGFYGEFCKAGNLTCPLEVFSELFGDIFTPIEEMIALQQSLSEAGIPTYIFSNTNELAVRYIRRTYPFFAGFTDYVLSYEHNSMKPDYRIYEVVERVTRRTGSQLVYLDDRPENIHAGAFRGWRSILHSRPDTSIRDVAQHLGWPLSKLQSRSAGNRSVAPPDQQGVDGHIRISQREHPVGHLVQRLPGNDEAFPQR